MNKLIIGVLVFVNLYVLYILYKNTESFLNTESKKKNTFTDEELSPFHQLKEVDLILSKL